MKKLPPLLHKIQYDKEIFMKVLMLNGSPNRFGSTYTCLQYVATSLAEEGIDSEIIWLGDSPLQDCVGCDACKKLGKCIFDEDIVNEILEKSKLADGFVFGSPVYYASPGGRIISVLNRLFYSGAKHLAFKPATAVVSARRSGTTASLDVFYKYFSINQMPIVTSQYWNMAFGRTPEDIRQDYEGVQTMSILGKNMAWILKSIKIASCNNQQHPSLIEKTHTDFIR